MFAAAAQLQASHPHLQTAGMPTAAAPGVTIHQMAGAADGLQAALQESQRQAAAAAQMMQSGQLQQQQQFGSRERLIGGGGQGSGFQLPADVRQVAASTTATGIEVVVNQPGKKLMLQAAAAVAAANAAGGFAPPAGSSDTSTASSSSSSSSSSSTSAASNVSNSSSSTMLLGAAAPLVIPPPTDAVHLKPGSGSSVLTALGAKANSLAQADMLVWIGYQKSHRMMGKARLHCISGCVCQDVIVDAWHSARVSHLAMAKLRVTQHKECRVGVEVLQQSSSGHHKFKVAAVMVSRAVEYTSPAVATAGVSSLIDGGGVAVAAAAAAAAVHPDIAMMSALEEAGHSLLGGH
jgi:hypothetical protein